MVKLQVIFIFLSAFSKSSIKVHIFKGTRLYKEHHDTKGTFYCVLQEDAECGLGNSASHFTSKSRTQISETHTLNGTASLSVLTGHISERSEMYHSLRRNGATGDRVQAHYNTQLLATFYLY